MFNAATGIVKLSLDTGDFEQQSKKLNKTLSGNIDVLGKLDKLAKGFLLGGSVGLAFFLKEASAAQETIQKFEAVFKEQSGAANEFVAGLASELGRSKTELKGFLSTLQDTFVPLGFARDEARQLSQSLTTLALDLAAFNDKADSEVLKDLQSALVGNTETVRKYGIVITEARLKQQAFIKGLNPNALTESEKALLRYQLILEGSADAMGTALREAGSFAGQMKALKSGIAETAEEMGNAFLPEVTRVLENLNQIVPKMIDWVKANKELILNNTKLAAQIAAAIIIFKKMLQITIALRAAMAALAVSTVSVGSVLTMLGPLAIALAATAVAMGVLNQQVETATMKWGRFEDKVKGLPEALSDAKRAIQGFNLDFNSNQRDLTAREKSAIELLSIEKKINKLKKEAKEEFLASQNTSPLAGAAQKLREALGGEKLPTFEESFAGTEQEEELNKLLKKRKEIQNTFTAEEKSHDKKISMLKGVNELKLIEKKILSDELKITEQIGINGDAQLEKIDRQGRQAKDMLDVQKKNLEDRKKSENISKKEIELIDKLILRIEDQKKKVDDLTDQRIKDFEKIKAKEEQDAKDKTAKEKKANRDSILDFTQTEEEKSKRAIKEEEARLLKLSKTEEERKKIAAAARKQLAAVSGAPRVVSDAVTAFQEFQADLTGKEQGLVQEHQLNALEIIAKNTENIGGLAP